MLHNVSDTNSSLRGESFEEPVALGVNSEKNQLLGTWGDAYYLHSIAARRVAHVLSVLTVQVHTRECAGRVKGV
jgi:hypothetical protein